MNSIIKSSNIDYESINILIKEIELRKSKINQTDSKFFDCFVKSLFRNNISKIDNFIKMIN